MLRTSHANSIPEASECGLQAGNCIRVEHVLGRLQGIRYDGQEFRKFTALRAGRSMGEIVWILAARILFSLVNENEPRHISKIGVYLWGSADQWRFRGASKEHVGYA